VTLAAKTSPQPLPANNYTNGTAIRKAYDTCRSLEESESWNIFAADLLKVYSEEIMRDMTPTVAGRVLGYGLLLAPSEDGRAALVRDINGCEDDPELLGGLAHLYVFGLIRVFYNPKGPSPAISASQSPRGSFEAAVERYEHLIRKPGITSQELRELVSFRDENRCVLTGALNTVVADSQTKKHDVIFLAHIISQSLPADENVPVKFNWAKTAGALIERFGGFSTREVLGEQNLNSPRNAFMASGAPHQQFDGLNIWLTPAKDEHGVIILDSYDVSSCYGEHWLATMGTGVKSQITFQSKQIGTHTIPAPDPRIIALHAACAKIAHMSAAAEPLEVVFRNPESIRVLTDDGAFQYVVGALGNLGLVSA